MPKHLGEGGIIKKYDKQHDMYMCIIAAMAQSSTKCLNTMFFSRHKYEGEAFLILLFFMCQKYEG